MATLVRSKKSGKRRSFSVHKPRGKLSARVEAVGPTHFGIVAVDCAKLRSKWMLCDFYGNVLSAPAVVSHELADIDNAFSLLRRCLEQHKIKDVVVAIERTGNYHRTIMRSFSKHGFECRIVHPFATKQFRQPADPGNKTDDTDLAAIHRATTVGFGLLELPLDPLSERLRLLTRYRRDLVSKRAALRCQIYEYLDVVLPGYSQLFADLWDNTIAMPIARHFESAAAIQNAGIDGLIQVLRDCQVRPHRPCLERILAWSRNAAIPDSHVDIRRQILLKLDDDRAAKTVEIQALERDIAGLLARTPYILLLSIPGINVVSDADYAGEMGPISNYANARAITGRAGLFPSRYQSDAVDHHGSIIRCANCRLRAALMTIADNLVACNHHFRAMSERQKKNKDGRRIRVEVASRFSRMSYQIVGGKQVCRHPGMRERGYILEKLMEFHREHDTPMSQVQSDLQAAVDQLPCDAYEEERAPLIRILEKMQTERRGPQAIGEILPLVLAKLAAKAVQSERSGDQAPN